MPKKPYIIFFFTLIILIGGFFYFYHSKKIIFINPGKNNQSSENTAGKNSQPKIESQYIFVSGWIPYWAKQKGADSLNGNLSIFSEINPFAFEVDQNGNLVDKMDIKNSPWPELFSSAKNQNVNVIPTILWTDADAMHNVFSDNNLLNQHINSIKTILDQNNFSGADIDYEGKDVADKDLFSNFIQKLDEILKPDGKSLECTIEARTQDDPPEGWSGTRAMSYANDYTVLNKYCDTIKIMAYDEAFQVNGTKTSFENSSEMPSAPNADNSWDEQVIQYASKYFSPQKIMLGVPTYGWEFKLDKLPEGYQYTKFQSVSYSQALLEAKLAGIAPTRDGGGELSFVYQASDGNHIVTFSDGESIQEKVSLVQKYGLKGISLFKIDGLSDPSLFSLLGKLSRN